MRMPDTNSIVLAPAEFDYSQKKKQEDRARIKADVAKFLKNGGKIRSYDNSGQVKELTEAEVNTAKLKAKRGIAKPDTKFETLLFNKRPIRIYKNSSGVREIVLIDVSNVLHIANSSFALRFGHRKEKRKLRVQGITRTMSTVTPELLIEIISSLPDKMIDPKMKAFFIETVLSEFPDATAKAA